MANDLPDDLRELVQNQNMVLILGIPNNGPRVGVSIVTATEREELMSLIKEIQDKTPEELSRTWKSVCDSVKGVIIGPNEDWTSSDFKDDLIILFAMKLASQLEDDSLDMAGLMSLYLWIDGDQNLPWEQRGMLDPKFLEEMNIDDRPTIMQ